MKITKQCICGNTFETTSYRISMRRGIYCSRICSSKNKKQSSGYKLSDETKARISKSNTGKKRTEEVRKKLSEASPAWWKGKKRTVENIDKLKKSKKGKHKGDKNPNWKGGISSEAHIIRTSEEYNNWRIKVFRRDNFTCQKYKIRGSDLTAHHIKNFKDFPGLRFNVDNGITLSRLAHLEFHKKYGNKNNTVEQLEEFLK